MTRLQTEFYRLFAEHGTGDARVTISPQEVAMLIFIAATDLAVHVPDDKELSTCRKVALKGFYEITHNDIESLPDISKDKCFAFMASSHVTDINDVMFIYVKNLCDLYRRRFKYYQILKSQPFPNSDQIVPRSLLEYGSCPNGLLADWLEWRKWIFDIDNRSAQETGYVFEPILASCLGGTSVSSRMSPVKRIDDNGAPTTNGRQIDCYVEDTKEVYELKMRVTIAASGQGRFKEEMSFPYEAEKAGLTPILVVFDENESSLLNKLKQQYVGCGGRYYIGHDAWTMLKEKAGHGMGIFINNYIYPPINAMETQLKSNPSPICLQKTDDAVIISGKNGEYQIKRKQSLF